MAFKQVIKDIIEERSSSSDRNHYLPVRGIHAESVGQPEWKMAGIIADGLSANNINILQMAVFQRWLQQVRTLLDAKRESLNDRPHFVAGIPYLVEGAKSRGLKTAICTAGHDQFVGQALKTFGTYELYDELVFTNLHEGVRHKPEPDPYLKAFELLGIESRNALVFEDSVSGALSGIRSGATVLFQPAGDRKPRRRAILKLQEQVLKEDYNLERYSGRVILLAPGEGWRQVRFGVGSADTALSKAG
jgi:HAD superfamily hydrolase (TIGR01509 family)